MANLQCMKELVFSPSNFIFPPFQSFYFLQYFYLFYLLLKVDQICLIIYESIGFYF